MKTYTITVRRWLAWLVALSVGVLVGPHAWLVNAGLVLLAALFLQTALHVRRGAGQVTTTYVDRPSADAREVADAIQQASIRNWMLHDMEGQR